MTAALAAKVLEIEGLDPGAKFVLFMIADSGGESFGLEEVALMASKYTGVELLETKSFITWFVENQFIVPHNQTSGQFYLNLDWLFPVYPVNGDLSIATPQTMRRAGYVYLIKSSTGHYKIGRTMNPNNRIQTFKLQLPIEVEYECLIKTADMIALEKNLHGRFSSRRVNGEWFSLEPEDVQYIKGLAL